MANRVYAGSKFPGVRVTLRKKFGSRVANLRRAADISQEALADRCGFARSYVERAASLPAPFYPQQYHQGRLLDRSNKLGDRGCLPHNAEIGFFVDTPTVDT